MCRVRKTVTAIRMGVEYDDLPGSEGSTFEDLRLDFPTVLSGIYIHNYRHIQNSFFSDIFFMPS
jgi:hypothetical protein